MFRQRKDPFIERVESTGGPNPDFVAAASDPTFHGQRELLPGLESPAVYPENALLFLAATSIRLKAAGIEDEIGWPFAGTAEEFLASRQSDNDSNPL